MGRHYDQWLDITTDSLVLDAIAGYRIPFTALPPTRSSLSEPEFSQPNAMFCDTEVERLQLKGAIVPVEPCMDQFLSPFFLVEKPSGGKRFILNLRELNRYIEPPHFKLEDWRTVIRLMLPGTKMATLDLEDAYLLVPIFEEHRKFLRFQWRRITYEFTALPFGLSTAPYIFTKILRPVVTYLRERGHQSIVYLDDFLFLGSSTNECQANIIASTNLLQSLGFVINYSKSRLNPSARCKYLGFIFDSDKQSISIPPSRREKLLRLTSSMANRTGCSIREFASFIGSLISVCPAVQYGLLYTKEFEREKFLALNKCDDNYSAGMKIPSHLQEDFRWWIRIFSNPKQFNKIRSGKFAREIFSDASLNGWGAAWGESRTHGWWSENDKTLHINALELRAAFNALRCFASDLHNCNILLRIDNTTALAYINKFGSIQFPHLSAISKQIWRWCEERNIFLFASYISSIGNSIADAESRLADPDTEWSLSDKAFRRVSKNFGPFDVDLFASLINNKCDTYVSWFPDPGAITTDAFTLSWEDLKFYAFPPFILLPRVLRKIVDDGAAGVLVVPWWPSQAWFPLFRRLSISDPIVFSPSHSLLSSPFRDHHPAWRTLSLVVGRLSGRHSRIA